LVGGKLRFRIGTTDVKPYFHGRRRFFENGFGFGNLLFHGDYT
jgi:hypothetical protein